MNAEITNVFRLREQKAITTCDYIARLDLDSLEGIRSFLQNISFTTFPPESLSVIEYMYVGCDSCRESNFYLSRLNQFELPFKQLTYLSSYQGSGVCRNYTGHAHHVFAT